MMKCASNARALVVFALICVVAAAVSGCGPALTFCEALSSSEEHAMWTGRTTLMESAAAMKAGEKDPQRRLADLCTLATSQRVLSNTATTLSDLGLKYKPDDILAQTSVSPVKDTNIITIEVTLPDATQAKVSADVLAAELKKAYTQLHTSSLRKNRADLESRLKTAKQKLTRTAAALKKNRVMKKTDIAALQADYRADLEEYSMLRIEVEKARKAEQQGINDFSLKTVDPAYVFPAK